MNNINRFSKMALVGAVAVATAGAAQAGGFLLSNDFAGWLAPMQTLGTGTFVETPAPGSGVPAVQGVAGLSFQNSGNAAVVYQNFGGVGTLVNTLGAGGMLEWTLPGTQNGFGGHFEITDNNSGLSFMANDVTLGWIDVTSWGANQPYKGFFGFSSMDPFTAVRVVATPGQAGQSTGSSYAMTDVSVGVVPEPQAYAALAALGLVGFGIWRRMRA